MSVVHNVAWFVSFWPTCLMFESIVLSATCFVFGSFWPTCCSSRKIKEQTQIHLNLKRIHPTASSRCRMSVRSAALLCIEQCQPSVKQPELRDHLSALFCGLSVEGRVAHIQHVLGWIQMSRCRSRQSAMIHVAIPKNSKKIHF